jgi:hypothetical protein
VTYKYYIKTVKTVLGPLFSLHMKAKMRGALMKIARERGADPAQWYGTLNLIR